MLQGQPCVSKVAITRFPHALQKIIYVLCSHMNLQNTCSMLTTTLISLEEKLMRQRGQWVLALKIRGEGSHGPNPLETLGDIHETLTSNFIHHLILHKKSTIIHPFSIIEVQGMYMIFKFGLLYSRYFICTTQISL